MTGIRHRTISLATCLATGLFFASCLSAQESPPSVSVTLELRSPDLADDAKVFVSGSLPALGDWSPGKKRMTSAGNQTWRFQFQSKPDYPIEYKYTLGSWAREAADSNGNPLKNFAIQPKSDVTIKDRVLRWTSGEAKKVVGQITGTVKYHRQLTANGLLPRDVVVWLPPGYEETAQRYPVLYMHDGQNIVDPKTSAFGVDWQVDETLTQMIENKEVQPLIVVGIYNTPERSRDYLPGPQGKKYETFVCEKLKPLIDKTYRTNPARQATAIAGSSAGGICAFTMAWNRPDVFSKAICMSPAFQYRRSDGSLSVDYLQEFSESHRPTDTPFFYIDNGGVGLERLLQPGIDELLEQLQKKGLQADHDYVWKSYSDARHDESSWAQRMPTALQLLFGTN